jgi:CubicO group peptidase (beta-lactamase class C family)
MPALRFPGMFLAVLALASIPVRATEPQSLDRILDPYLKEFGLPALAAAVFQDGSIVACATVGTRRAGVQSPVTITDRFHIGSDSKVFTSLLAGQFVQAGKLSWNSTPAESYPEIKGRDECRVRQDHTGAISRRRCSGRDRFWLRHETNI